MNPLPFSGRRAFVGDVFKYIPSIIVPAMVGILLLPITTNLFSQSSYGNYALAISALSLLQIFTNAWLSSTIFRFFPGADSKDGEVKILNSTALVMIILQSLAVVFFYIILMLLVKPYLNKELFGLLFIIPLQMLAINVMSLPLEVLRARRQIGLYTWLNIIRYILPPAIGIGCSLYFNRSVFAMMVGSTAIFWLVMLFSFRFCFGIDQPKFHLFQSAWAKKLTAFGLPLIPVFLMTQVLDVSDRFIIGAYRGNIEVGLYTASYSLASLSLQLLIIFSTSAAAPLIISTWERQGRQATELLLTFVTRVLILVCFPALIGLILLARESVLIFSTSNYVEGAKIIPFVASGVFLLGLQWIAQRGMMLAHKTSLIMWMYLIAGFLNILANLLLVPKYGYMAAGWTTFGAYLILLLLIARGSAPYLTWKIPYPSFIRSLIGSAVMGLAVVYMNTISFPSILIGYLTKLLIGFLIYVFFLFLSKEITPRQIYSVIFTNQ